jgi:SpoVK/Ycf46/Vps4 family AAA+-type ATPase
MDETTPNIIIDEITEDLKTWIKSKDMYFASTSLVVSPNLDPGVYTIDISESSEFYCSKLKTRTDDLFVFTESQSNLIVAEINKFWAKKDLYKEKKLLHKRGILLEGFPGTGKSCTIALACEQLIEQGGVIFKVMDPSNFTKVIQFLRHGFRKIQPDTPILVIIEHIDQYESVYQDLLDFLDGQTTLEHWVVIATTNDTTKLEANLLRPNRFDLRIEIPLPDTAARLEYFRFKDVPENDLEEWADSTEGCSFADLKEIYICVILLDYSFKEALNKVLQGTQSKNYLKSSKHVKKLGF